MKTIRTKCEKQKPNTGTVKPPGRARRSRCAQHQHKPEPLCEVVLLVDTLAVTSLCRRPPDVHRLLIGPGPEDDCFLVEALVSPTQFIKLAAWAASMEPNVTVRSTPLLRALVEIFSHHTPDIIAFSA